MKLKEVWRRFRLRMHERGEKWICQRWDLRPAHRPDVWVIQDDGQCLLSFNLGRTGNYRSKMEVPAAITNFEVKREHVMEARYDMSSRYGPSGLYPENYPLWKIVVEFASVTDPRDTPRITLVNK